MSIKYYLHPTNLHKGDTYYTARVIKTQTLGLQDLLEEMRNRGTTVSDTDTLAVVHLMTEVIFDAISRGRHYNLPFGNFSLGVTGRFESSDAPFDKKKHRFTAKATIGKELRRRVKKGRLVPKKAAKPISGPIFYSYENYETGERNKTVTPNGIGTLAGHDMKFDKADPEQGVFFIQGKTSLKADQVPLNEQSKIILIAPAELKGDAPCRIEIRNKRNNRIVTTKLQIENRDQGTLSVAETAANDVGATRSAGGAGGRTRRAARTKATL